MRLKGKVALITGSTSGIGRASAVIFAEEGAKVVICGRREREGKQTKAMVEAVGGHALFIQTDVTSTADVDRMVGLVIGRLKRIDILFNNAGTNPLEGRTAVADCPEDIWDTIMDVNVKGVYRCCKAVIPHMIRNGGGSIINTSSVFGLVGFKRRAAYAASKGAVLQLTKSMAVDYGPYNIRINCICPGMIRNERVKIRLEKTEAEGTLHEILADFPLHRIGDPEDVARLAVFLASDAAGWMTGTAVPLDGGFTAR